MSIQQDGFLIRLDELNNETERAILRVTSPQGESRSVDFDASDLWMFDDSADWLDSVANDALNRSGF